MVQQHHQHPGPTEVVGGPAIPHTPSTSRNFESGGGNGRQAGHGAAHWKVAHEGSLLSQTESVQRA